MPNDINKKINVVACTYRRNSNVKRQKKGPLLNKTVLKLRYQQFLTNALQAV